MNYEQLINEFGKFPELFSAIQIQRDEIIKDLFITKGHSAPSRLYHYTSSEALREILQSNLLWATEARSLNDSTELIHGTTLLANELEEAACKADSAISTVLIKLAGFYTQHSDNLLNFFETFVISLSESKDMLSQWRAYSNQAKGCCIEFEFTDSRIFAIGNGNNPIPFEILPVIYDEAAQRKLIRSGIEKVLNHLQPISANLTELKLGIITGWLFHAFKPYLITFKHFGFAEEKEWRAVVSCPRTMTTKHTRNGNTTNHQISYVESMFLQEDSEKFWQRSILPITGVMFAPLADNRFKSEITKLLACHGYGEQASISSSCIPLRY